MTSGDCLAYILIQHMANLDQVFQGLTCLAQLWTSPQMKISQPLCTSTQMPDSPSQSNYFTKTQLAFPLLQPIPLLLSLYILEEPSFVFSAPFYQTVIDSFSMSLFQKTKQNLLRLFLICTFYSTQTTWWSSFDSFGLTVSIYLQQRQIQVPGNKCISGFSPISCWWVLQL